MTTEHWSKMLPQHACGDALQWAATKPDADTAWAECERGDWMLWLLGALAGSPSSDSRKKLVFCVCACARLALRHVPEGELRPLAAIETAERWSRGEATLNEVRNASDASAYAANAADAARNSTLKTCANIVRQHYPAPPRLQ